MYGSYSSGSVAEFPPRSIQERLLGTLIQNIVINFYELYVTGSRVWLRIISKAVWWDNIRQDYFLLWVSFSAQLYKKIFFTTTDLLKVLNLNFSCPFLFLTFRFYLKICIFSRHDSFKLIFILVWKFAYFFRLLISLLTFKRKTIDTKQYWLGIVLLSPLAIFLFETLSTYSIIQFPNLSFATVRLSFPQNGCFRQSQAICCAIVQRYMICISFLRSVITPLDLERFKIWVRTVKGKIWLGQAPDVE